MFINGAILTFQLYINMTVLKISNNFQRIYLVERGQSVLIYVYEWKHIFSLCSRTAWWMWWNLIGMTVKLVFVVVLRIYVTLLIFQPYRDLEAGDTVTNLWNLSGEAGSQTHRLLAPQAKSLTTRPPLLPKVGFQIFKNIRYCSCSLTSVVFLVRICQEVDLGQAILLTEM